MSLKVLRPAGAAAGLVIAAIAGIVLLPSAANAANHSKPDPQARGLFQQHCAVCHGDDGAGSQIGKSLHAPDLHSKQVQGQSDAYLANFIKTGKGAMPPFGSKLSSQQIGSLVHYIRYLGGNKK